MYGRNVIHSSRDLRTIRPTELKFSSMFLLLSRDPIRTSFAEIDSQGMDGDSKDGDQVANVRMPNYVARRTQSIPWTIRGAGVKREKKRSKAVTAQECAKSEWPGAEGCCHVTRSISGTPCAPEPDTRDRKKN
ncbi:hypothetical protein TNCV_3155271 [Trichonephila clavipes]|nr:hypothetical protein TNCV_3155271 [Trichonephila clavipes]